MAQGTSREKPRGTMTVIYFLNSPAARSLRLYVFKTQTQGMALKQTAKVINVQLEAAEKDGNSTPPPGM